MYPDKNMTITISETPRGLSNVCPDQIEISYWFIYFALLRTRLQKYFFLLVSFLRIYLFLFCRDKLIMTIIGTNFAPSNSF